MQIDKTIKQKKAKNIVYITFSSMLFKLRPNIKKYDIIESKIKNASNLFFKQIIKNIFEE